MPIQYRINILESLKEQGINTTEIKKEKNLLRRNRSGVQNRESS